MTKPKKPEEARYLLLQTRDSDDTMREHERMCFATVLDVPAERIALFDLLGAERIEKAFASTDVLLLGGSGAYSAAVEANWLERALLSLRAVHASGKPTFASCWGFQAMARAMGGRVVHDVSMAEVGNHDMQLTDAGRLDPVFSPLGTHFSALAGHEDSVVALPPSTTLLASSGRAVNQAYRFDDAPIYCTQFHPELDRAGLLLRFANYPKYVESISGLTPARFAETVADTPTVARVIRRFVERALARDQSP